MSSTAPAVENVLRPDQGGTLGRRTRVTANFFAINQLKVDIIYHYDISISPELPPKRARQLWSTLEAIPPLNVTKGVFDSRANAFTASKLSLGSNDMTTLEVTLPERTGDVKKEETNKETGDKGQAKNQFKVKLVLVKAIYLEELHRFIRREGPMTPAALTAIQALNVVLTHKVSKTYPSVGRSIFTANGVQDLGGGVEVRQGIFQSVRPAQGKIFANIDVAATAFIKSGNVATLLAEVLRTPNPQFDARSMQVLNKHFKGLTFQTIHRPNVKRRFKAVGLSTQPANITTFVPTDENGKPKTAVTIVEYFQKTYGFTLQSPAYPCLGAKAKDGTTMWFPVEVCILVDDQKYSKKLDEDQTANMIKTTCTRPVDRARKINENFAVLDMQNNEYLKAFKMQVSTTMTSLPARVLESPMIEYKNQVKLRPVNGGWNLNPKHKMHTGAELRSWGILSFDTERNVRKETISRFVQDLSATLAENGMTVTNRNPPIQYVNAQARVDKSVEEIWKAAGVQSGHDPQLILVILPRKCQTYSDVKRYCELSVNSPGRMTQCVLTNKILRPSKQYCGMLGLKINAKLGGVNHVLGEPIFKQPTIVFGADVTHPAPGETGRPSIAAVVASRDKHAFKYAGRVRAQTSREEIIVDLKYLVHEHLMAFKDQHKVFPTKILFYRDGVSETQSMEVLRMEVMAIKEACRHLNPQYNPQLTFIVVRKRHHARFFPSKADADRSGNCPSGTVVDTVITHPTEFDFYLQSQGGLQGTSRPTLYHVLVDENKFSSDEIQGLTFMMCHVYARCPKSVSIVPSVYWAHLLSMRSRHYDLFDDMASVTSGGSGSTSATPLPNLTINPIMRNAMFFC